MLFTQRQDSRLVPLVIQPNQRSKLGIYTRNIIHNLSIPSRNIKVVASTYYH